MQQARSIIKIFQFAVFAILINLPFISFAAQTGNGLMQRTDVQTWINQAVPKYHLNRDYIVNALNQAQYVPQIIPKMQHALETSSSWGYYHNFFITPDRIQQGVNFYNAHEQTLNQAQAIYGVPADIIVAILGVETRYGQLMGTYRVIDTLTTLAFEYPPRAAFFQDELGQFLYMTKTYNLDPTQILGSRSGAMGLCQFMPSSYLAYAVTYGGGSKAPDIFNNPNDAIFSIANFLSKNGWVRDAAITSPADVVGRDYKKLVKQDPSSMQVPSINIATFKQFGVLPAGSYNMTDKAYLMGLDNFAGREYWLGFNNFYTITHYNNSDLYAMAVYQFGQAIIAARADQNKPAQANSNTAAQTAASNNSANNQQTQ